MNKTNIGTTTTSTATTSSTCIKKSGIFRKLLTALGLKKTKTKKAAITTITSSSTETEPKTTTTATKMSATTGGSATAASASASAATAEIMISMNKLLSTCVDACSRGCQVIRHVNNKRQRQQQEAQAHQHQQEEDGNDNGSDGDGNKGTTKFNVTYKVANDPRSALTEADLASQRVILYCLRHEWGSDLNIIGEEDSDSDSDNDDAGITANEAKGDSSGSGNGSTGDSDNDKDKEKDGDTDEDLFQKYSILTPCEKPIQSDLCSTSNLTSTEGGSDVSSDSDVMVSLSDLTLYIDPMDGTREFVEQRLHNVQCLIGITWKGQPIGGIIGLPFLWNDNDDDDDDDDVHVVCGLNWGDSSFVKNIRMKKGTATSGTDTPSGQSCDEDLWLTLGNNSSSALKDRAAESNGTILNVFTGDSSRVHKKQALQNLENWTSPSLSPSEGDEGVSSVTTCNTILDVHIAGGCGNKILRTTASGSGKDGEGGNALSIIPPGTCSWDTAAPTAILFAALLKYDKQGKVTDMFGGQLVYDSLGKKVTNDLGALVSIGPNAVEYHNKLCKAFRGDEVILSSLLRNYWMVSKCSGNDSAGNTLTSPLDDETRMRLQRAHKEPQAIDFVRNESGYVMTCDELKTLILDQVSSCDGFELIGYSVPEKDAVRGIKDGHMNKNENGELIDKCVIHLMWEETKSKDKLNSTSSRVPSTVGYEKITTDKFKYRISLARE